MTNVLALIGPLLTGAVIGLIFFGGLWWTLKRALLSRQPVWGLTLSLILRTGLALLGFYWLVPPHWPQLLSSLLGFTLVRLLISRYLPATEMTQVGGSRCT